MPRYKLVIEYDGAPYSGWQRQTNAVTVQETLEAAARKFCGVPTRVMGAGRTDTGVHAMGQVAHADFEKEWPAATVRNALNALVRPAPIAVLESERVDETFDARHSATGRHYRYAIINRRAPLALEKQAWQIAAPIDVALMNEGAQHLLGHHDFTTFRATQCQANSPMRTLDRLVVRRDKERIEVEASARSFLHNQVRSMVGTLVEVGAGRWAPEDVATALAARARPACGPVAPAQGLILMKVDYA
ncbi:tRNA pseudouridine(38-40) synthase TruA [Acuticoccus sp. MNP-M23]|uniref:tRNA pseudouridine(38-40) synthase TruA n=1 Tax=Acuticoccus sp. MNP-M23 TaxID=3072793 RepID=UPI002815CD00|nr:tRNA pseudouridine(38-40) synthase TruA [Acuticoccus sp. MNP-M23]WMS41247.1 tRNA pseudouridine(38-40) synthase TruA [Acuticoccus sp. MNP-M23]